MSAHFRFFHTGIDHANIEEIAENLEVNYDRMTGDLKVESLPRINIHLYPTLASCHAALARALHWAAVPSWVIGAATRIDEIIRN